MDPHKLVAALVEQGGGSLPVARAMGRASFQPTLHKVAAGLVASPKHSTAERIAKHFGIPIEALYDRRLAARVYGQIFGNKDLSPQHEGNHLARVEDSARAEYRVPIHAPWPLPRIDPHLLARLKRSEIRDIESAMLTMAAHLGVSISKRHAA